jgi:hypothetical protein
VILAGCGGSSSKAGGGLKDLGVSPRLASCTDWRRGTVEQRYGTVRAIRRFAGGPVPSPAGHGPVLKDSQAYKLFQGWCAQRYASAFKLYRLYTRAASFVGH